MKFNRNALVSIGVVVAGVLFLLANAVYVLDQNTQAIVLRFGEPLRTVNEPGKREAGLHLKAPFVENIVRFEKRSVALDTPAKEILVQNGARLTVDSFIRYRISDPLQFYRAFNTQSVAEAQLATLIDSSLKAVLGSAAVGDVVTQRRSALMQAIETDLANRSAASKYGIQVLDFRLGRVEYPESNRNAVYERMRTDRAQIAAAKLAEGNREASAIKAEAEKQAGAIRGQADADRARIFAESFGKDPNFAAFYRSMQAYEASLAQGDTTLVVSPDFLRYFTPSSR